MDSHLVLGWLNWHIHTHKLDWHILGRAGESAGYSGPGQCMKVTYLVGNLPWIYHPWIH